MGPRMFVERKVLLHTNNAVKRRNQKFPGILRGFLPRSYKFDARLDSKKNWLSDNWVRIQSKLGLVELKDEDRVIWSASKSGKFTHAASWEELRTKKDEVMWWRLIWFELTLLKRAPGGWKAIKDKLLKWGYTGQTACMSYKDASKTGTICFGMLVHQENLGRDHGVLPNLRTPE